MYGTTTLPYIGQQHGGKSDKYAKLTMSLKQFLPVPFRLAAASTERSITSAQSAELYDETSS